MIAPVRRSYGRERMPENRMGSVFAKGESHCPACATLSRLTWRAVAAHSFPGWRRLIIDCWRWLRDHRRIWVGGYVVMDDHVHVLMMLREGSTLARVLDSFKTYTATRINRILARKGAFWQEGYYDTPSAMSPTFGRA